MLMLTTMAASAQWTKSIHITTDDGIDVTLSLSRQLNIKFTDTQLIATDGTQTITADLDKVKLSYETTASITTPKDNQRPVIKDNTIIFQGIKAGTSVAVYAADGKLVRTIPAKENDGSVSIDLNYLPKGVSIIRVGKLSLKYRR